MYFKKNWGSMAEKRLPLGRIDIFQTSPGFQTLDGVLRALTRKNKKGSQNEKIFLLDHYTGFPAG